MSEKTDEELTSDIVSTASAVAELAAQAIAPRLLAPGELYTVADGEGKVRLLDTDPFAENPRKAVAHRTVLDAPSFVAYIDKHGLPQTEVWADQPDNTVIGIIDAHQGADRPAGWGEHKVQLRLEHTKAWLAWKQMDGLLVDQIEFANFIDLRASDVHEPTAAVLVDLARHFTATKSADFESSQREQDGQIRFEYKETIAARVGQKGTLEVPEAFRLALKPYIGGPAYWLTAKFRYRLTGGDLKLGYVLDRPEEVLESAFTDIVTEIRDGRRTPDSDAPPSKDVREHAGISQPIFYGRP